MKISIGFSRPIENKIGAKLIAWEMGCDYSHTFIRWHSDKYNIDMVYHATSANVSFISGEVFDSINTTVYSYDLEIGDECFNKLVREAILLCGTHYSVRELAQIWMARHNFPFFTYGDCPGYICSELVAHFLEGYFNIKFDVPIYMVTPKDIKQVLETNNG